ncbi:hypothetical protein ABW20_dc0103210 [Dactylellina cionopaga]|nr:hypothetical protein ABW20_dc0103210 [Dactylellina cionopaga]
MAEFRADFAENANFRRFCERLEVVYDEEQNWNTIGDINGGSNDLNKGQGGGYVYLRAHYFDRPGRMIKHFDIVRQSDSSGESDLAKGAGGDYRYIRPCYDIADYAVTDVALWRCDDKQWNAPEGWHEKSADINEGRGGDYLYLIWRTETYNGPRG